MADAFQQYYEDFGTAYWRDENPEKCKCRGGGWALSELDTWHQCPCHYNGQQHPNVESEEYDFVDPTGLTCTGFHPTDVCMSMAMWARIFPPPPVFSDDEDIPF